MAYAILTALAIVALLYQQHQHSKQTQVREKAWELERTGLITRIQHPEFVIAPHEEQVVPDEQLRDLVMDEIDLVGTVQYGSGDED